MTIEELKGLFGDYSVLILEYGLTKKYVLKVYLSSSEIKYPEYNGKQYIFMTDTELDEITKLAENSTDFIVMTPKNGEAYYLPEEDYKDEKTRNEQFQILKENGHTLSFEWDDILKIGLKKKEIGSIKDVAKSTFSKRDCEIDSKIITLD